MQALVWVYVVVAVVLLFGAAIFVHEFGHFWMARRRGLKVEGFSIGFGPKIYGWTRDGIDYAWRWIPAGGYVKLPQMITSETLEGKADSAEPLPPISAASKILVAVAGPLMNGVFAFLIACVIFVVGLPVRVNPAVVGFVEPGSAEAKLGIQPGDRIVAVNGKPVASWEEVQMTAAMATTNMLPVTIKRGATKQTYVLAATVNEQLGLKLLNLEPMEHPVLGRVLAGSAAEAAGLNKGDQVLALGGAPVVGQEQFINLIKKLPGQTTTMQVLRDGKRMDFKVTPKTNPTTKAGMLGVEVTSNITSVYQVQWPGPPPWELVGSELERTFATIGALVHSKETGVGLKDLSGPPGILAMLAVELRADIRLALRFMVLLNISLAILNLLPMPVLDGGHILMALIEKLRGKPLSLRVQEYATTAFAVVLISFMLYVSYNDVVKRLPLFRIMFKQEVQIQPGESNSVPPPK